MSTDELVRALKTALSYDPHTGLFTWTEHHSPRGRAGQIAGYRQNRGYWSISFKNKQYLSHRLAWLMTQGEWPVNQIDHINGDRLDNRLSNLRDVGVAENCQNKRRVRRDATHGAMGVVRISDQKWQARIGVNGRSIYLGVFTSVAEAHNAYKAAKQQHHGVTL